MIVRSRWLWGRLAVTIAHHPQASGLALSLDWRLGVGYAMASVGAYSLELTLLTR